MSSKQAVLYFYTEDDSTPRRILGPFPTLDDASEWGFATFGTAEEVGTDRWDVECIENHETADLTEFNVYSEVAA